MNLPSVPFERLAEHSEWPRRLLSSEPPTVRLKTEVEVLREYELEKWARLLERARELSPLTLEALEHEYCPLETPVVYFENGQFWRTSHGYVLRRHLDFYARVLERHAPDASALVELGAGYGSKIFALAERPPFAGMPLAAAEMSAKGREMLELLAGATGRAMTVGHCDFRRLRIEDGIVPPNSLIFTSYAAHYVPELADEFVDLLASLRPRAVVHFEPFFEHFSFKSIHDLMCRRYMEINDYTRNLQAVLDRAATDGRIRILSSERKTLGANPFLPISAVAWAPNEMPKADGGSRP